MIRWRQTEDGDGQIAPKRRQARPHAHAQRTMESDTNAGISQENAKEVKWTNDHEGVWQG